jgi:hypothetical protein
MFVLVKAIVFLVILILLLVTADDALYTTKYFGYSLENYLFFVLQDFLIFIPH